MKLDEAIERLTDETVQLRQGISPKWIEACQLGIEALKHQKSYKGKIPANLYIPLPGETE